MEQTYSLNPITALAIFKSNAARVYVLAGEDVWLKAYDSATLRLVGQVRVFDAQAIHGIHVVGEEDGHHLSEKGDLLIWGGRSVSFLPCRLLQALLDGQTVNQIPREATAKDWIFDASLSPRDPRRGVLVTAHNEVVPVSVSEGGKGPVVFSQVCSPCRPILYSANVSWLDEDAVLVAGGTVFGEIIVWRCCLPAQDNSSGGSCAVLHVLLGHEGSIFGVAVSPEVVLPSGRKTRLLASCSDDRTIRIWDVPEQLQDPPHDIKNRVQLLENARETGFGSTDPTLIESTTAPAPLAVAMGHLSRIWKVKFLRNRDGSDSSAPFDVYSFGEDATTQQWRLNLAFDRYDDLRPNGVSHSSTVTKTSGSSKDELRGWLTHVKTLSSHGGKHVWAAAVLDQDGSRAMIATGGADGGIALVGDFAALLASNAREHAAEGVARSCLEDGSVSFTVADVLRRTRNPRDGSEPTADATPPVAGTDDRDALLAEPNSAAALSEDRPQQYAFMTPDRLLATTTSGQILIGRFGHDLHWSEVDVPEPARRDFRSSAVVKCTSTGVAFIGTATGALYMYSEPGTLRKLVNLPSKIADLFCLPDCTLSTPEGRSPITNTEKESDGPRRSVTKLLVTALGLSEAVIIGVDQSDENSGVTRATVHRDQGFVTTAASICGGHLVLGSRAGWLSVYGESDVGLVPRTVRKDFRNKEAITCILPLPGETGGDPPRFLTTSRDGKYRIYAIEQNRGNAVLHLHHETSPPFGPMLQGAWLAARGTGEADLILCGFRSKQFVVWNESKHYEIASVDCGGGHRSFAYASHPANVERLRFVYTKKSTINIYSQTGPAYRILKDGGHGREIRAVACNGELLAIGAEDTIIRILTFDKQMDPSARVMQCLAVLQKHTVGIQSLKWCGGGYLLSSAGAEELFVWRVTWIGAPLNTFAVVREAAYPDLTPDGDLRIMSFDVEMFPGSDGMCISLALSNSTLKTYRYSREEGFRLLCQGQYTGACLMQIRHLQVKFGGDISVLTTSTDGHIAVWTSSRNPHECYATPEQYSLVSVTRLHQSGIKSLDITRLDLAAAVPRDRWLVITGGDDNALGISCLERSAAADDAGTLTVVCKYTVRSAHAASITGVSVVRAVGPSVVVVTASNDQRVKLWRVHWDEVRGTVCTVALLEDRYSSVADAGDLEVVPGSDGAQVAVGGVGLEVWRLRPERWA